MRAWWILPLLPIALGVATTLLLGRMALDGADRATGSSSSMLVRNGTELWFVRRLTSFGLEWINCERSWPPLANEATTMIDIPSWAIPPNAPVEATELRVATLAVGWPAPYLVRQWTVTRQTEIFPLPVELDDGADSLRRAAERLRQSDPAQRRILWRGAILDVGVLSLAWLVVGWTGATLYRVLHGKQRNDEADEQQERGGEAGHSQQDLQRHSDHA
ncbi:MAG: hypothetical protein FJ253_07735 [Phycisphaerae bacterium]|nr:hypothetical protein [Phycisphaerae bacterium]